MRKNAGLIDLSKEKIDQIFKEHDEKKSHQSDVLISIYEIAIPDFRSDDVESVSSWPRVSKETQAYVMGKFMAFDRKFHPNVMNGGLWFNNGFGTVEDDSIPSWKISMVGCEVHRKSDNQRKAA